MSSTAPLSYASPKRFKQNQSTAALATWLFHATVAASGADATGLVPVLTISKAGGAFASPDGSTAVTELTNGWYKVVHAAADLNTEGSLACRLAVATMDTVNVVHEVVAVDDYNASPAVELVSDAIDVANITTAAQALFGGEVSVKGPTLVGTVTQVAPSVARSMKAALDVTVILSGTFGGATVQVQTTEDETAGSPVWTDRSSGGLTAAGQVVITGPHSAWRAIATSGASGTTAVGVKATTRHLG
jgi:hypothetical protein